MGVSGATPIVGAWSRHGFHRSAFSRGSRRPGKATASTSSPSMSGGSASRRCAVLVANREGLAFAEVLAENGYPTPLVLDDPLAYSDDARLAAMCGPPQKASLRS